MNGDLDQLLKNLPNVDEITNEAINESELNSLFLEMSSTDATMDSFLDKIDNLHATLDDILVEADLGKDTPDAVVEVLSNSNQ